MIVVNEKQSDWHLEAESNNVVYTGYMEAESRSSSTTRCSNTMDTVGMRERS
jgi:hypothetical protein